MVSVRLRGFLLVATLLLAGCRPPVPSQPRTEFDRTPVSVSAEQLTKELLADRDAAIKKYQGRIVTVDGEIENPFASRDLQALEVKFHPALQPAPGGRPLVCKIRSQDRAKAERLSPGQKVVVKGTCAPQSLPFPELTDCELVRVGEDPAPALTSIDLAREFAADSAGAAKKWNDKFLIVTGVVTDAPRRFEGQQADTVFTLEGVDDKDGKPIRVAVRHVENMATAQVKVGDKVTIKGQCNGLTFPLGIIFAHVVLLES